MRAEKLDAVAAVLGRAEHPLDTQTIVDRTGFSIHTVRLALSELGAVADRNWPKGWSVNPDPVDTQLSIAPEGKPTVAVELMLTPLEGWAAKWGAIRTPFIAQIADLDVTDKEDPKELAFLFERGASILASIGASLHEVQHDPDWYAKLHEHDV